MKDIKGNYNIIAIPKIVDVVCPKCRNTMIELEDGWFSIGWWCNKCQCPYRLSLVKYGKYDKAAIEKQLKELKNKGGE
jgi:ssDNA-binding Zn-finger/Zn-ribbon topoisomerase 1